MKKLKKLAVLPLLAVVLLSCMPEQVQAADIVQKEDLTGESEHGEPLFDKDAARASTCSGSRIEFNSEYLGYNMYFATPHNYCVVDFPSGKDYEQNHTQYIFFIDTEGTPWDPYEVRDGEYARGYNQSVTNFSGGKTFEVEGQSVTTSYVVHFADFYHNHGKWNEETYPSPVHQPPVIHMPSRFEELSDEAIEYLLGCLTSGDMGDCRVTAGDSDNPDVNEPGGVPGSEDNPIYDEKIGMPVLSAYASKPSGKANVTGNNLEYYDCIEWEKKTSTGFNLTNSGYAVCRMQFKIEPKATFVELGKSTVLKPEVQTINGRISLGFCNASQLEKKFQYHDLISKFYGKFLVEHHPTTNAQSYELQTEFNYYCRVIVSDSLEVIPSQLSGWKCGKWKRVVVSGNYEDKDYTADSGNINDNGEWESDEDYENIDDGDAVSDDPANADKDDIEKDMDYGIDDVKGLLKQVGQFPKFIKKLFSFLPSWCLTLVGFGFSCMILILIIKAVRG